MGAEYNTQLFRKYPCRETRLPDSLFPCYNKAERLERHWGGEGVAFVFEPTNTPGKGWVGTKLADISVGLTM